MPLSATTRLRHTLAGLGALVLFGALAGLVAGHWSPLSRLDDRLGSWPFQVTREHAALRQIWQVVGTVAQPEWVLLVAFLIAIGLAWKGHRRAAAWTVGVMIVSQVASVGFKRLIERPRPHWSDPIQTLHSYSFPSGHSTAIGAAAGVTIVLAAMLVRRRVVRRVLTAAAVVVALIVGADRLFLGVHHASDIAAGWLLGAAAVLLGLAVFDPRPRSIARTAEPLPQILSGESRTLAVVLNPVKVDDPGQFRAMVDTMARESGFAEVRWWETEPADTGFRMAHEAAVGGATMVLVIGGDGTLRAVCEELAGTGVPVGIVPAGTGNLLARNLGIPLYLRAAVDVALNGQDRAIDMVTVSGDGMDDATFLVMAGMGFDAAIMEGVNEDIKARVGWLAYVWSALKSLMFPAIRVEVSLDGGDFTRHRARTIVIGNVGFLQGGMPLLPDADIDDGRLDVVLIYPRRFLSWLRVAARVLSRNPLSDETVTRMTGRRVVVRAGVDTPRQLDGDLIAPGKELRAECVHGRLLVRVPR